MTKIMTESRRSARLNNKKSKENDNTEVKYVRNKKPLYIPEKNTRYKPSPKQRQSERLTKINLRKRAHKAVKYFKDDDDSVRSNPYEFESDIEPSSGEDDDMKECIKKFEKNYKKAKSAKPKRLPVSPEKNPKYKNKVPPKQILEPVKNGKSENKNEKKINVVTNLEQQKSVHVFDDLVKKNEVTKSKTPPKQNVENNHISNNWDNEIDAVEEIPVNIPDISDKSVKIEVNNSSEISIINDTPENINDISPIDKTEIAKSMVEDLTKSFLEDDSPRLRILSNVVIRKAGDTSPRHIPKPWRWEVPCRNGYGFTYKDKSFTPRYEPNYDYKIVENKIETKKKKPVYQTSITNFLLGEKPKIIENNAGIFGDIVRSPRKALAEINIIQSTPIKPSRMNISHDISAILNSPKKDLISEDKENIVKKKPKPKKIKKQGINLTESISMEEITVPLFDELEDELIVSKTSAKKYVRKYQKRKRMPSSCESEAESDVDVVTVEPEKKKKNVRTKKEEMEANRLAKFYNSMFEDIEKHNLIIE